MSTILWFNDKPAEDYGLGPREANWWDSVRFERPVLPLAGQLGQIAGPIGTGTPRELNVTCLLEASSVADRRTKLDQIARELALGAVEIRIQDDSDRVLLARYLGSSVSQFSDNPYGGMPYVEVELQFVADDPTWFDRYAVGYGLSTSATQLPLGTLPSSAVLYLEGASDPVVTYKAHSGETVATLSLDYTWASGDVYRIDLGLQTIDKIDDGVRSNAIATYATGDFFALDPRDGDPSTPSWPTITLSTGTGVVYYQRRYA